jgi:uncharacterized protein (DUF433 family)
MNELLKRITIDSDLCNGRPTLRGLRITVHTILDFLSAGSSEEEILAQYPDLEKEDIRACLAFASEITSHQYFMKAVA